MLTPPLRLRPWLVLLALSSGAAAPPAVGQPPTLASPVTPPPAGEPADPTGETQVADRLAQAARELTAARRERADAPETLAPALLAELDRRIVLLERLDFLLAQEQLETHRVEDAKQELTRVASERLALADSTAEGVVPIPELDALIDEVATQRARTRSAEQAAQAAGASAEQAKASVTDAERKRSQARSDLDEGRDGPQAAALEARLVTARLAERVGNAELGLRRAEARSLEAEAEVQRGRQQLLEERLARSRPRAVFTPAQLAERVAALDALDVTLAAQGAEAKAAQAEAENAWAQARLRLSEGDAADPVAVETERSQRLKLELLRRRERAAADGRGRVALRRTAWERRQTVLSDGADAAERDAWQRETQAQLEELKGQEAVTDAALVELRRRRSAAQERIATLESDRGTPRPALTAARSSRTTLDALTGVVESELESIDLTNSVLRKLDRDLEASRKGWSWVADAGTLVRTALGRAWSLEIGTLNERIVTLGGLVKGLLVLLVGLAALRYLWAWAGGLLKRRFGLDEAAASTLESIAYYVSAVLLAVLALQVANVPLTAFTLLGGALAIGIGFGTQNLMNNFISGLLLLVERPIRVGDLIEVRGGTTGTIRRIGARSTAVLTGAGIDILVPNSYFLENEVVNWTLGDNRVRTSLTVGFAYGSSTREIARILKDVAVEHGRVMPHPEPFVLFSDFGDNALIFELFFWVRVSGPLDARRVQSSLRFMIDNHCREAGLVIAFPQRDVHLDAQRPFDVRILRETPGGGELSESRGEGGDGPS